MLERARELAIRSGDVRIASDAAAWIPAVMRMGETHSAAAHDRWRELIASTRMSRYARARGDVVDAVSLAMSERFEEARAQWREGQGVLAEFGDEIGASGTTMSGAYVEQLAGDLEAARRIELRLERGPVVEAALFRLPDELIGPAKVFLLFVPGDTLLLAGDLVAFDDSGAELGREYFDLSAVSLFPKVLEESPPEAVAVMRDLQLAGAVVGSYSNTHGSYSGLDPDSASAISSEVEFNTSPVAIPDEVSIRVSGPQSLVLASATEGGAIYSACMEYGPGGAVYGRNDTSDPQGCTNGWLDPSAEPPPTGGQDRIATGSDPNGNLWSLTLLDVSGPGAETPFELELLIGPIGASRPLQRLGDADLGSIGAVPPTATPVDAPADADLPTSVWGIASDRVARVELRVDDGGTFDGELYAIPPGSIDAEQAFLFLVPVEGPMTGTVVAFDSQGEELQRREVESLG